MQNIKNNKEITKQRLSDGNIRCGITKCKIYIMNDDGGTMKYLPLQPVESTKQTTPPAATRNRIRKREWTIMADNKNPFSNLEEKFKTVKHKKSLKKKKFQLIIKSIRNHLS